MQDCGLPKLRGLSSFKQYIELMIYCPLLHALRIAYSLNWRKMPAL